jgi:HEAT repeat protein
MDKQEKAIKAYFYNGKTPMWDIKEVEEPCFTIPVSIIIKDVASKINRAVFNLSASDGKVDALTSQIDAEIGKETKDPYARPFWKVLELGYTNNPKATEPLKKYTQDRDEFLKSCALSSIGTLGADGHLDFLIQQYRTAGGYNDKYMAAKAIGDIGTPAALQVLQDAKKDKSYASESGLKYCVDLYVP